MKNSLSILSFAFCVLFSAPAAADCYDDAGEYHQVNHWVLRAFAQQESRNNPNLIHQNSNSSVDLGLTGINSIHLNNLRKYGITERDLLNGCVSIYVRAWLYRQKMAKYGNTWDAVGATHSETPKYRDAYIAAIQKILRAWQIIL